MEKHSSIGRPLFCDTNSFGQLSINSKFNNFCEKIDKSNSSNTKELLNALQKVNIIKDPITSLEILTINQKEIFKILENEIQSKYGEVKNILKPFINELGKSSENEEAYITLANGLSLVVDLIYESFLNLLNKKEQLSYNAFLKGIEEREKNVRDPSVLFINFFDYLKDVDFDEFRTRLIHNLAIEAIFSFGTNIIIKLYPGNKWLKERWYNYIGNLCINLKNEKQNISGYRPINTTIELLNNKFKLTFYEANLLRPYDDLIDSYLIHGITFGWFDSQGDLYSILGITSDPYQEILSRVQQYQIYLAYEQNPIKNNLHKNIPILFTAKPGILYVIDNENKHIKCLNIQLSTCYTSDSHSEVELAL